MKQKGDGRADGEGVYRKPHTAPAGEVSVVTGSAGQNSRKPVPLNHPAMWVSFTEAGSVILDIDALHLDLTFINADGQKRDWFSMVKE